MLLAIDDISRSNHNLMRESRALVGKKGSLLFCLPRGPNAPVRAVKIATAPPHTKKSHFVEITSS